MRLFVLAIAAIDLARPSLATSPRRVLRPKDNVGEIIKGTRGRDEVVKKRYTIHTEIEPGSQGAGTELAMDVVEATNSAVTPNTKIKDETGNEFTVGNGPGTFLYTLLVTDTDTAEGSDTFSILAVNPETDDMHGIVEKRGPSGERIPYKIKQTNGENQGKAMAQEEMDLPAPDWHCDVGHDVLEDEDVREEEETLERRSLLEDEHDHRHRHQHRGQNLSTMDDLTKTLRGIKTSPLKARRLGAAYNFEVDLFIEIDNALIGAMGSLNNAINYVNVMVSAANTVFEKEIDTHLRVTDIVVSNLYDAATSTSQALDIMRTTYAGVHPDVDLHHALLGGINGGGIAYIGVVCRNDYGFGLTSGLKGTFQSMGDTVLWDMKGFMHEIGHNFGSKHTNEVAHYDPPIDTCGLGQCPATPGYGWSTIMSVCQGCPGAYGNIMYSFGADYDGSGDVNDILNWPPNPTLVANYDSSHYSVDPNREAQRMYLHVFSKAPTGCVALSSPAPLLTPAPTPGPTSSDGIAFYDSSLGAPKCSTVTTSCSSGSLLNSRGGIGGISEPNGSNTLDSCSDGATGSYHVDESVDSIKVSAVGGGNIQPGGAVKIDAKVWAYSTTADFVDFFYANDATNPQWQLINTLNPSTTGANDVSSQYTLGNGSVQAVRVVIRYNGSASPCPGGGYDDVDDLAFNVGAGGGTPTTPSGPVTTPSPTKKPTAQPTKPPTPLPTTPPTSKPIACGAVGTYCDSSKPNNCCSGLCQSKGRYSNTCK